MLMRSEALPRPVECPRCKGEAPVWSQVCPSCGTVLFTPPAMQAPADLAPPQAPAAPPRFVIPQAVRDAAAKDYKPHLTIGLILAFSATLVVPPLTGAIAMALGWMVYTRGAGAQKKQGLLVMAAAVAGMAVGLGVGFWVQEAGFLGP